jgi:Fur family ferric uptake transcriptional regulator
MTTPAVTAPLAVPSLEAAMEAVRDRGLRLSSARRLVLEALSRSHDPITAEDIAAGAGGVPPSDIASVYRNLETLERVGIVRHFHMGHGPGLYALAGEAGLDYLVCESCGKARAVDPGDLDEVRGKIRARFGFEARFSHFPLFGLCADCVRSGQEDPATSEEERADR